MSRQLAVSLAAVGVAVIGAAFGFGLFERGAPPPPSGAPAETPAPRVDSPSTPPRTPAAAPAREAAPVRPSEPAAVAPPTSTAPLTATLHVQSDVPGADVFVDNQFAGKAPATVPDVQPGRRRITVSAAGYESVSEFHDLSAGSREIVMSLKTIRLDRRLAVEHRHRLGSCSGTLIASPSGLRYETSRKEDAFGAELVDIESFTADYLKKNLEVRVRGGRSYDFTNPSGSAADLYEFFQEVEKVRQRVMKGRGRDDI